MRYSLGLPTHRLDRAGELVSGAAVTELAHAAEGAGFDACYVTDHPFPPERWLAEGGHHALDPFVALSFAAAATSRLRLQTHVLVLPYRNPFVVAKAAASLDVLSGGRLTLGVAAGYLRGEFAALGADFEHRNEVTDEGVTAIKLAWTTDDLRLEGRHFHAVGNTLRPRPAQQPHPPLWVGGNSQRAIRRAVELADGWVPFPNPAAASPFTRTPALEGVADLAQRLAYAREHAQRVGRTAPLDVCYALRPITEASFDAASLNDEIQALSAVGVTWLTVPLEAESRASFASVAERFGREVIGVVAE